MADIDHSNAQMAHRWTVGKCSSPDCCLPHLLLSDATGHIYAEIIVEPDLLQSLLDAYKRLATDVELQR